MDGCISFSYAKETQRISKIGTEVICCEVQTGGLITFGYVSSGVLTICGPLEKASVIKINVYCLISPSLRLTRPLELSRLVCPPREPQEIDEATDWRLLA